MSNFHPSAVISPNAKIGENVAIGPFSLVEDDVEIGDGTHIYSNVVIGNGARIGKECKIFPGAVIAMEPQDLKFKGEKTLAIIGDRTTIRECVTINRGTTFSGEARIGSDCLIMAYCHVAHDCVIGDHVVMGNGCQLAGHVTIHDWAILGGMAHVHQFCTVGKHTMIGATVLLTKDVAPYALTGRDPIRVMGINKIGLRRRGFSYDDIDAIDAFYQTVFFSSLNTTDGIERFKSEHDISPLVQECIDFIENSKRGVYR
ncbi:MAG: acyl-ACP--UDP-N-acetylglucosamine O-acyltransferase [Bacteroidota bacterium]